MSHPTIIVGDVRRSLRTLGTGIVQMLATSPPYFGLRRYGNDAAEVGAEPSLDAYVGGLVDVMREGRRVLRDDGTAWINLGDSYASSTKGSGGTGRSTLTSTQPLRSQERQAHEPTPLDCGIPDGNALLVPFRVAAALQADGWILRAMLPWVKIASMPESVQSRPCIAHEYVLFLTKRASGYFYDADAVRVALGDVARQQLAKYERDGARDGVRAKAEIPGQTIHRGGTAGVGSGSRGAAMNPAGRSLRSSDFWRAGAADLAYQLQAAAEGEAVGMLTNDDSPAAFIVNPKGSGIPHFAMWPTRLVAPMILAGTPEAGCCSVCGAPWMRVVESVGQLPGRERNIGGRCDGLARPAQWKNGVNPTSRSTIGFRPSCDHDAPTVPATVLDPFVGAGTTLAVAECLGRHGAGCELYQKNADLYPQRLDIVRAEIADYLRERAEGDKAAAVDADAKGQTLLF
jgi:DNA modification methylase